MTILVKLTGSYITFIGDGIREQHRAHSKKCECGVHIRDIFVDKRKENISLQKLRDDSLRAESF